MIGSTACARLMFCPSIDGPRRFAPARWYRSTTMPQPCRNDSTGTRGHVSGAIQDGRPDAPRADMRTDRSSNELDRHVSGVESGTCRDLVAERLDIGTVRVQDRQPLDRSLGDQLDHPLTRLGPRPDLVRRLDQAVLD